MTRNPSTAEEFDDWADASEGRLASRAALLKPMSAKPNRGTLDLALRLAGQMADSKDLPPWVGDFSTVVVASVSVLSHRVEAVEKTLRSALALAKLNAALLTAAVATMAFSIVRGGL